MKKSIIAVFVFIAFAGVVPVSPLCNPAQAKGDDFSAVVKVIERFYHVKHQSIPFLARAGIKTATAVARIAGGPKRQLAEAGSIKVAFFDDQEFNTKGGFGSFKTAMNTVLGESWSPLVQVVSAPDEEQTYIFLRDAGEKFNVLVVNIGRREGSVVQVNLSPRTLATLMQNPNEMGREITVDATTNDNE